jgi:predicted metal-dependent hydrolase
MNKQIVINDVLIDYEVVQKAVKNPRLEYRNSKLKVIIPEKYPNPEEIVRRHQRWIYNRHCHMKRVHCCANQLSLVSERGEDEFKALIHTLVDKIGDEIGIKPEKIRFRKMKTKWGSCSSKGHLNFNYHMRQVPEEMIEYVVFHEMVHLIELNHSSRFWKHIESRYPDHKEKKKELSSYWYLLQNAKS